MLKSGLISSPGRICVFGEHQDYLDLPVIPMAINKRLYIHYEFHESHSSDIRLVSKQLKEDELINSDHKPQLSNSPFDYQKSVFIHFWNEIKDLTLSSIRIDSEIPISAGLSSSAALLTSTVYLLSNIILDYDLSLKSIAEIAFKCEHDIMNISCGRMDQYASAIGGIFHMTSRENPKIIDLNLSKKVLFIIGNSGIERKADIPLKTVQYDIFDALRSINNEKLEDLTINDIKRRKISKKKKKKLIGVIGIKDNTTAAVEELSKRNSNINRIGQLINEQQTYLRENYKVSHPKLDEMCTIALNQGAIGAKLTGAGFGGSMFAIADEEEIAVKIKESLNCFGLSFITKIDTGLLQH
ncbi:MAG: galactokinase family protein [Candidatus Hodarchaeota archaeon]